MLKLVTFNRKQRNSFQLNFNLHESHVKFKYENDLSNMYAQLSMKLKPKFGWSNVKPDTS